MVSDAVRRTWFADEGPAAVDENYNLQGARGLGRRQREGGKRRVHGEDGNDPQSQQPWTSVPVTELPMIMLVGIYKTRSSEAP